MPTVYLVPGIGGTSLGTSPQATDDTWVSYTAMALGLIGRLRLAADGFSPGSPDGVPLFPGYLLPDYYQRCQDALNAQLGPQGWKILPHAYDWRLDAQRLGGQLAARIIAGVSAADPCTLVAHSYGGLVSRLAWASLVGSGQSNLVRRIITLGTPHWGSYGAVRVWSLDSDELNQVFIISVPSSVLTAVSGPPYSTRFWTPPELSTLIATFPSLYWTLPSLLAPDARSDVYRGAIYANNWPADRGVSLTWLADATSIFAPLLFGASTQPPSWVLTCVAGVGLPTPNHLLYPQVLGQAWAYDRQDDGDGTVTTVAALLAGGAQYITNAGHMDLPRVTAEAGWLTQWILDPRGPPSPPPPLTVMHAQLGHVSSGPPSPLPIFAEAPIPRDP